VKLTIYEGNGREVNKPVKENLEAGKYSTTWEGGDFEGRRVAVGIYYCRLEALNSIRVREE
jgi:flagellar hook assembly protein FlgD